MVFKDHVYVNLEDLEFRQYARSDPKGFLQTQIEQSKSGIILDEFQHVPDILSYVQIASDERDIPGFLY